MERRHTVSWVSKTRLISIMLSAKTTRAATERRNSNGWRIFEWFLEN